jgi:hypothetical protein
VAVTRRLHPAVVGVLAVLGCDAEMSNPAVDARISGASRV